MIARWERALACKVQLVKGGVTIELTGRQVVGLEEVATRSPGEQVAFEQEGRRVVLSLQALRALRHKVKAM